MTSRSRTLQILVAFGLLIQVGLFIWSMEDGLFSVFCTSGGNALAQSYSALHLVYFALFLIGGLSFASPRMRLPYCLLLAISLPPLAYQPALVETGAIHCDAP